MSCSSEQTRPEDSSIQVLYDAERASDYLFESVHEQFRKQVELRSAATAIICGSETVTYAELGHNVTQISRCLIDRGIGSGDVVGVLLDRTAMLPAALLGILESGAAYLPLDAFLPRERILSMLEDAGANLVLTQQTLSPIAKAIGWPHELIERPSQERFSADGQGLVSGELAYVVFTSGSTGRPKGVEVLHRGLANFLNCMRRELCFSPGDRMLAHSSLSFDIAAFELFLPLTSGGSIVLVPRSVAMQGDALRRVVETSGLHTMLATPSGWQLLVNAGWKGDPNLTAISGGEILHPALGKHLVSRTRALWNHYGPSETTIAATTYRVNGQEERFPIGRLLPNLTGFVLDEEGNPVASGEIGELQIGGVGLARGYRNRPELTSERFVYLNVGDGCRPERVYRTGDLVRELPGGEFEFAGRVDNQVKVRGFRIELEEIEIALAQHPVVRDCAVLAVERGSETKSLVAFFTLRDSDQVLASDLRMFLRERLPDYMTPSSFLTMKQLPMTAIGKVDRHALQSAASEHLQALLPIDVSNEQSVEKYLLGLWCNALGHPDITPNDSFFDLGGTSLMAAVLVTDIQKRFGIALPLSVFFEAPTITRMAQLLSSCEWSPSWSPLVPIQRQGSRPPLFCIHPIGGNVLSFQALSTQLGPDQPVYGLQARGLNGSDTPHSTIEAMAADYLSYVRRVAGDGPCLLAGYSAGGIVAFEMARQLEQAGAPPQLLVLVDSYIGDPSKQPESTQTGLRTRLSALRKFLARFEKFASMETSEKIASIMRNTGYTRGLFLMELRIRLYTLCERFGMPAFPLRFVHDAFALAVRRYEPQQIRTETILFRAAKSDGDHDSDESMGWDRVVDRLTIRKVGGTHFTVLQNPLEIGRDLSAKIAEVCDGKAEAVGNSGIAALDSDQVNWPTVALQRDASSRGGISISTPGTPPPINTVS